MRASVLRVQSPELVEGDQQAEHVDDDPEGVGHVVPGRALECDGWLESERTRGLPGQEDTRAGAQEILHFDISLCKLL